MDRAGLRAVLEQIHSTNVRIALATENSSWYRADDQCRGKWFNIAAFRAKSADELADIASHHNKLAHVMTSSQIAEAQKLAREWRAKPER